MQRCCLISFFYRSHLGAFAGLVNSYGSATAQSGCPLERKRQYPIEFAPTAETDTELVEIIVPSHAAVAGKSIVELGLPHDCLIALISKNENFIVPSGGTLLEEGDVILVLVNKRSLPEVRAIFSRQEEKIRDIGGMTIK